MGGAETDLGGQVAPVAGGELVEGLGAHVAAPEGLGGDDIVQRREGLLHRGADGRRLVTHLQGNTQKSRKLKPTESVCGVNLHPTMQQELRLSSQSTSKQLEDTTLGSANLHFLNLIKPKKINENSSYKNGHSHIS